MTMYTIQATKNPVHDFVHDFKAFVWHLVVFYNITKIANSFVFNGGWYCVALCGMMGFRASLSAKRTKFWFSFYFLNSISIQDSHQN